MKYIQELEKRKKRNAVVILALLVAVIVVSVACLFVGSSNMSIHNALNALLGGGNDA